MTSGPWGPTTSRPITLRLLPGDLQAYRTLCRRGRRALPAVKQVWVSLAAQADKEGWLARLLAALAEHEIASAAAGSNAISLSPAAANDESFRVQMIVGRTNEKSVHRAMSTPDHDCLDAETILNDLCASKINASISRIGDGGFHFVLGDPPQAEGWAFSTIGAAAISLRDEACAYYPDSDFGRKYGGFVYDHPWPKGR